MGIFGKFLEAKRLPYRKIETISSDEILITCDFLEEKGFKSQSLNRRHMGYLKPLRWEASYFLRKRFPHLHLIVKRQSQRVFSQATFYQMFSLPLLEEFVTFLHISHRKHIGDDIHIRDLDLVLNLPNEILQEVARKALQEHPELFQGKLLGTNHVPRATLNTSLWDVDHEIILSNILPHQNSSLGTLFNREGLELVVRGVTSWLSQKWKTSYLPAQYLINYV